MIFFQSFASLGYSAIVLVVTFAFVAAMALAFRRRADAIG